MKGYLFLDFDGVINVFEEGKMAFPSRKAVSYLNQFILETNLQVVLTSTWRLRGVEYCYEHLKKGGLSLPLDVFLSTQTKSFLAREEEISLFLSERDPKPYLVVDDASLILPRTHFVQCHPRRGWDEEVDHQLRHLAQEMGLL